MQAKLTDHNLKLFTCQFHPSETIERVCIDPDADRSLQCIECVLQNKSHLTKDKFCSLVEFIENAIEQYAKIDHTLTFIEAPPSDLVDFLNYEEKKIKTFVNHIEKEKHSVNETFDLMVRQLTELCSHKRAEILAKLDMQVILLKNNYANYKNKIDKYFKKKDPHAHGGFDKDSLLQKINSANNTLDMEILVRNIKDDISQFNSTEDPESKIAEIKADLRAFADELNTQSNQAPKSLFNDPACLEDFHNEVRILMNKQSDFHDSISDISGAKLFADSNLITTINKAVLIKKWLAPAIRFPRLHLLYRGSRDGFTPTIFHKKCDGVAKTLTVVRALSGNIFGGYSDQQWGTNDGYKQGANCWLFSLDHKEKYPVKSPNLAVYPHQNYGPSFGDRHDLFLDGYNSGTSNLGYSYKLETGVDQSRLAGSNQFKLDEIEVFEVYGQIANNPTSNVDSKIIDLFDDFKLIHNWTTEALKTSKNSKIKNIEFKLIYRGSCDGFDAQAFHSFCDNQGATLTLCKAQDSGFIFGGFTSQNWSRRNAFFQDKTAFLFSVTHKTKHPVIDSNNAIFCSGRAGPVFGKGYDLFIAGDEDKNDISSSTSKLGVSYKINSGKADDGNSYLAGAAKFKLQEIEVFRVLVKKA